MNRRQSVGLMMCALLVLLSVTSGGAQTADKPAPKKAAAKKPAGEQTATGASAEKKPMKRASRKPAEEMKPEWFSVAIVRVRPDSFVDWQNLQKNVVIPALKKSGLKSREIWEAGVFGEVTEVVVVTPIESFAQYDDVPRLRKALGEDAYRDYLEKVRKYVTSSRTMAAQSHPDLSYMGKMASMTSPPKLAVVNSTHVVPGHTFAFENLIKTEVIPAMKKVGVIGYVVSRTELGGDPYEYTSLTFYDNFAEIGKGSPVARALGTQGVVRLSAKISGMIASQERVVARYNSELSFQSAP